MAPGDLGHHQEALYPFRAVDAGICPAEDIAAAELGFIGITDSYGDNIPVLPGKGHRGDFLPFATRSPGTGRARFEGPPAVTGPVTTQVKVQEGAQTRTFSVTVEPVGGADAPAPAAEAAHAPAAEGTQVFSTFAGSVEVVDVLVKVGDKVNEGDVVAAIEAMKAKHDIKAPTSGTVSAIHVSIGDEIDSTKPIVSIA